MEDINDEIVAVEQEKFAAQEQLADLLKAKAHSQEESDELTKSIHTVEYKLKSLTKQLDVLYDIALEIANAAACDEFSNEDCNCYLF